MHMSLTDDMLLTLTKYTDGVVPNGMLSDIARYAGVSRERVRQRAVKLNLLTNQPRKRCIECDVRMRYTRGNYCSNDCRRKALESRLSSKNCEKCGKEFKFRPNEDTNVIPRKFCSRECYRSSRKRVDISVTCKGCGNQFMSRPYFKNKYCSHPCYVQNMNK